MGSELSAVFLIGSYGSYKLAKAAMTEYVTLKEFAETVKVSTKTIYEWLKQGKIRSYQYRKKRIFKRLDMENLIRERNTCVEVPAGEYVRGK